MKKIISALFIAVMATVMAVSAMAGEVSFKVFSDDEAEYIYEEYESRDSSGSRYHDGYAYIIYEFPIEEGDTVAQISWKIRNQYRVSATNFDPDDTDGFEVVYEAERTPEEEANGTANWGDYGATSITVIDLSSFTKNNKEGKIWVMMSDADEDNGWGGYIYSDTPVRFYSGTEPAPEVEQPKTPDEIEADYLSKCTIEDGVSVFFPGTKTEEKYLYKKGGSINGSFDRYMDGTGYSIYAFDVKASDTSAVLHLALNNQWDIGVATSDPDNLDGYTTLAVATPDATELGSDAWGERRIYDTLEDGTKSTTPSAYPMYDFDLTPYLTGDDGKIYIYIGDITPENGWGGMVCFGVPNYFAVNGAKITDPAEPLNSVDGLPEAVETVPVEEPVVEEAPAEEPVIEETPAEEPVVEETPAAETEEATTEEVSEAEAAVESETEESAVPETNTSSTQETKSNTGLIIGVVAAVVVVVIGVVALVVVKGKKKA